MAMRNANITEDFDFSQQQFQFIDQNDNSEWGTFKDSLRAPVHRWFTYPAGFSYKAVDHSLKKHRICQGMQVYDKYGTVYQVDSVIVNPDMQPLVVFESKYIRYKKHNRDKGSWICATHQAVRSRYQSIRKFIAVLAGRWSAPSLAMMRSRNIVVYEVGFEAICDLLEGYNIKFDWDEKDRNSAIHAYMTYEELPKAAKDEIGEQMIKDVIEPLSKTVRNNLNPTSLEEIEKVFVELHSNPGAIREIEFDSVENAMDFLDDVDSSVFDVSDTVKLTDPPQFQGA